MDGNVPSSAAKKRETSSLHIQEHKHKVNYNCNASLNMEAALQNQTVGHPADIMLKDKMLRGEV